MSASFDSYKIFYYVGKYKNITHAATALFLSQSTVSRCIQSLEAELGCKLFSRTQYGVAFTTEGETLYQHIAKACEQIFLGEEEVLRMQQLSEGGLRLGVSDITFTQFILPVLKDFRMEFPSVQMEIVSTASNSFDGVVNALLERKIDIACVVSPDSENAINGAVEVTPVATFNDMVIASDQFPELRTGSYSFSDLVSYPFISLVSRDSTISYLDRIFISRGLSISPEYKVDSINLFIPIAKHCQCLAVVPALFRDEFDEADSVFEVSMREHMPTHNISIITAKSTPQSAVRDAFIRQLKKYIRSKVNSVQRPR